MPAAGGRQAQGEGVRDAALVREPAEVRVGAVGVVDGEVDGAAGDGGVQARSVALVVLPFVELEGNLPAERGRPCLVVGQQRHRRLRGLTQRPLGQGSDLFQRLVEGSTGQGDLTEGGVGRRLLHRRRRLGHVTVAVGGVHEYCLRSARVPV